MEKIIGLTLHLNLVLPQDRKNKTNRHYKRNQKTKYLKSHDQGLIPLPLEYKQKRNKELDPHQSPIVRKSTELEQRKNHNHGLTARKRIKRRRIKKEKLTLHPTHHRLLRPKILPRRNQINAPKLYKNKINLPKKERHDHPLTQAPTAQPEGKNQTPVPDPDRPKNKINPDRSRKADCPSHFGEKRPTRISLITLKTMTAAGRVKAETTPINKITTAKETTIKVDNTTTKAEAGTIKIGKEAGEVAEIGAETEAGEDIEEETMTKIDPSSNIRRMEVEITTIGKTIQTETTTTKTEIHKVKATMLLKRARFQGAF
jgi:hypothetical protein